MNRIKAIFTGNLFRNIVLMSSATVVAQLINILVQPILTRIVPAETLGVYTFLVSMANIAIPVASLKLDMLIVSEADEQRAQLVTDVCIIMTMLVSVLFTLILLIGYATRLEVFYQYGPIIFTVPLMVFTNGNRFLFISYNNRYRQYKLIGVVGVLREATRAVVQVISGFFCWGIIGQVAGYILAPLVGFRLQTKSYFSQVGNREPMSLRKIKDTIVNGKEQILYLVPAQFANGFASSLIIVFISILYSSEQLGYYSASVRLLEIPLVFIAANVSKVLYKQVSEDVSLRHLVLKKFLSVSLALAVISFLGFSLLYMIAPVLSEFIFGSGYAIAGDYIRCLCLMYTVRLIATSFTGLFTIFEKQKLELFLVIILIISASAIYFVCKEMGLSITFFLWGVSIAYSILYFAVWISYCYLCAIYDKSIH